MQRTESIQGLRNLKGIPRRQFLKTSVATGFTLGFSGINFLIPHPASAGQEKMTDKLHVFTWGGIYQEKVTEFVVKPFEEETGVKVTVDVFAGGSQMLAKMKAGGPGAFDVVWPGITSCYQGIKQGLYEPFRLENMPNFQHLLPIFKNNPPYDPGPDRYFAPFVYGTEAIAWNYEKIPEEPKSWGILWDEQYKGKIAVFVWAAPAVVRTALYLGMNPNNIEDMDAVWAALKKQQPLVVKYISSGAEMQQVLSNETAWVGTFWVGRVTVLRKERNVPVKFAIPKEGVGGWIDGMSVAKGTKNRLTAEKFIDFALRGDVQLKISENLHYAPVVDTVKPSAILLENPDYDPTGQLKHFVLPDPAYQDAHLSEWEEKFKEIMVG